MTGRAALRALAAVTVAAALVAGIRADTTVRRDRNDAEAALDDAGRRLLAADAALAAAEGELAAAEQELDDAHRRLDGAVADAEAAASEREELLAAAAAVAAQADDAVATLSTERQDLAEQAAAITALQECVRGSAEAVALAQRDDTTGLVASLQRVSAACREAEAALGAPEAAAAFPFDFADPFVLAVTGGYYAYATNAGGGTVQAIASDDLEEWWWLGDALPELPAWAAPNATWAPSVLVRGDGLVAYYAARQASTGRQCVSRAVADHPAGPFVDSSAEPLVCQADFGGSIDPSPVVDGDGDPWLVWKSERPATIWSQRLADDGLRLTGERTRLLVADQPWEGGLVEAPSMLVEGGTSWLFYSGNDWNSPDYAVGWARCDSPAGPCSKGDGPLLVTGGGLAGPGGQELFRDGDGRLRMAYHAWLEGEVGYPNRRLLQVATVALDGGRPVIQAGGAG